MMSFIDHLFRPEEIEHPMLTEEMRAYDMIELDPKRLRELGNVSFKKAEYWKAISYYTKSLVRSPAGSRLRGLAYANRSAVLLNLGLYEECIGDALIAFENDYPAEVAHKLYLRMGLCKKALGKETEAEQDFLTALNTVKKFHGGLEPEKEAEIREEIKDKVAGERKPKLPKVQVEYLQPPPLSNGQNPRDPSVSAALDVREENDILVANRRIEVGEVLVVDNPFIFETNCVDAAGETRWIYCSECLKMCLNLRPCPTCSWACYCSKECEKEAWEKHHKLVCVAKEQTLNNLVREYGGHVPVPYRTITFAFMLLSVFGLENCINAIDAVEERELSRQVPDNVKWIIGVKNLKLPEDAPELMKSFLGLKRSLVAITSVSNHDIRALEEMANSFDLTGERKQKLIYFFKRAVQQGIAYWRPIFDSQISYPLGVLCTKQVSVAYGIFLRLAKIKASCDPNVRATFYRKTGVLRAIRSIEEGEEIFQATGLEYCFHPSYLRNEFWMMNSYSCECAACVGCWPLLEDQVICHKEMAAIPALKDLGKEFCSKIEIPCTFGYPINVFTPENLEICIKIHGFYEKKRRDDRLYNKALDFIIFYYNFLSKRFVIESEEVLQKPDHCIPLALKEVQ